MKTVPWPHLGPHDTDVMPFSMVGRDHAHSNKDPAEHPLLQQPGACTSDIPSHSKAITLHSALLPLWSCTTLAVILRVQVFQSFIS